jgi:hypothetical protein
MSVMIEPTSSSPRVPRERGVSFWSPGWRAVAFILSASSIWCLLAEFYGLCSMRTFTFAVLIPATVALVGLAVMDRMIGDRRLWRAVLIGSVAGLVAAFAYDVFRIPYVVAAANQVGPQWLRLPLYKVFPRFGAMILGEPFTASQGDGQFSVAAHVVGWIYHFSNGLTFGVMYVALIGEPTRRSWLWAIVFAVGLEIFLLLTRYTDFFGIPASARFVVATILAHVIFGVVMGLLARRMARGWGLGLATAR